MPALAVTLVLVSCVLHALWNLLLKRAHDKLAFTALYLLAALVIYAPLFAYLLPGARIPTAGWACIAGTGFAYFGYFVGLASAYRDSELSIVYPIIRSLGPALAFIGGVILLSEHPTPAGGAGVALILAGVVVLQGQRAAAPTATRRRPTTGSLPAVLLVALMIGAYSIIDKIGVDRLRVSPPVYLYLTYATSCLLVVPWVVRRRGLAALRAEWKLNAAPAVAVGALSVFTYLLVLYALSLPHTPISYIAPLRTASVVIGVLLGTRILGEGRLAAKLAGAAVTMVGIALLAWKG